MSIEFMKLWDMECVFGHAFQSGKMKAGASSRLEDVTPGFFFSMFLRSPIMISYRCEDEIFKEKHQISLSHFAILVYNYFIERDISTGHAPERSQYELHLKTF